MSQNQENKLEITDYMDKLASWIEKNSKLFVASFVGLIVLVGAFWVVSMMKAKKLNAIANESGVVNRRIELLEQAIDKAKDKSAESFKSNKKKQVSSIQSMVDQLVDKYPAANMTDVAVLRWASFLYNDDQKEEAFSVLTKVKASPSRSMSAPIVFLKALILSEKKDYMAAASLYDEVLGAKKWEIFHPEALIQKAMILEAEGKTDEATQLLTKAKDKNKDSKFSKDAAKYLRLIKLKKSQPDLFSAEG